MLRSECGCNMPNELRSTQVSTGCQGVLADQMSLQRHAELRIRMC